MMPTRPGRFFHSVCTSTAVLMLGLSAFGQSAIKPREIASRVLPSLVLITTFDGNGNPLAQGSGFVSKPGRVVSNLHVFKRASSAKIKNVQTGETASITAILGIDIKNDICVFAVDNNRFPALALGDSSTMSVGDEIFVASNPEGLEGSFTKGIISARRNNPNLIQFDAAISPGSSGGVLVNQNAETVGVVRSTIVGGQNLNFATPIEIVKTLALNFSHPVQLAGSIATNDLEARQLHGPVKSFTEPGVKYEFDREGYLVRMTTFKNVVIESRFDDHKLITELTTKDSNGKVSKIERIGRDDAIRMKMARIIHGTNPFNRQGTANQAFDKNGRLIRLSFNDGESWRYEYIDEDDNFKITVEKHGKVVAEKRIVHTTDKMGNWLEQVELRRVASSNTWIPVSRTSRVFSYYQ